MTQTAAYEFSALLRDILRDLQQQVPSSHTCDAPPEACDDIQRALQHLRMSSGPCAWLPNCSNWLLGQLSARAGTPVLPPPPFEPFPSMDREAAAFASLLHEARARASFSQHLRRARDAIADARFHALLLPAGATSLQLVQALDDAPAAVLACGHCVALCARYDDPPVSLLTAVAPRAWRACPAAHRRIRTGRQHYARMLADGCGPVWQPSAEVLQMDQLLATLDAVSQHLARAFPDTLQRCAAVAALHATLLEDPGLAAGWSAHYVDALHPQRYTPDARVQPGEAYLADHVFGGCMSASCATVLAACLDATRADSGASYAVTLPELQRLRRAPWHCLLAATMQDAAHRRIRGDIEVLPAINTEVAILSGVLTKTPVHVEDALLGAVNMLFLGAPKLWRVMHAASGARYWRWLHERGLAESAYCKTLFAEFPPDFEQRVCTLVQFCGVMVITLPGWTWHHTVSSGYSVATAMNACLTGLPRLSDLSAARPSGVAVNPGVDKRAAVEQAVLQALELEVAAVTAAGVPGTS
jgi:hypothetical protein